MTPQHILVPTDFSAHAKHALDYAMHLAEPLRATLTLLYVIYLPPLAEANLTVQMDDIETQSRRRLEAEAQRVHDAGLPVKTQLVHGVPWQQIVETAQDQHVDLIVMGTHGRTGIEHILLGSVAEKVVRLAPCPVLVVRDHTVAPRG